jgi:NAD(P)H-hydrate epimerase
LLVDADALTALAKIPAKSWRRKSPTILTPHTGELGRLLGRGADEIEAGRVTVARESARALQSIMVLKGAPTVCALPTGKAVVNSTGNPGMATIGTGDVLSGAIAGLLAQGMSPFDAAVAGVYLHGRAGDLAAQRYGQRSLLASDVLDALSLALLSVENS